MPQRAPDILAPDADAPDYGDAFLGAAVDNQRHADHLQRTLFLLLLLLGIEIAGLIRASDLAGVIRIDWRLARTGTLLDRITAAVARAYRDITARAAVDLAAFAEVQQTRVIRILLGAAATVPVAPSAMAVADIPVAGAPLDAWWGKQAADLSHRVAVAIRLGVMAGETSEQLVTRAIGMPTGRRLRIPDELRTVARGVGVTADIVAETSGGALAPTLTQAETILDSAVNAVANEVAADAIAENDDRFSGIQWWAVMDPPTCPACRHLDGTAWDFTGKLLTRAPLDAPYPGPAPLHLRCRCFLLPVPNAGKRWATLRSFADWLRAKPEAYQRDVLGPAKYAIWQQAPGRLSLSQLVSQRGNPMTLAELRRRAGL